MTRKRGKQRTTEKEIRISVPRFLLFYFGQDGDIARPLANPVKLQGFLPGVL